MKSLRQIIREEIDNSFDWVGDILDQTNLSECLKNKQLHVGDNLLIKGRIHNIHCGYISIPEDGVRVRINRIWDTNIKVTFIDGLPTQCTFGDFIPGDETLITNDSCGHTLFIEQVENINESNELDWLKDIANNEKHAVRFYLENNLLTKKGQIYKVSGEYYDEVDEKFYDIPFAFKAEIRILKLGWRGLMIIPLENVRIITGDGYVHYHPGEIYPITDYEYDRVYLEPILNESTNDFDWVKDIKPAINWNNIKPEDLINRDFILISRNRLYTIKGYNTSTGRFNIHNHETGKEHRLSLSEIEGLMFMGDIEFVI